MNTKTYYTFTREEYTTDSLEKALEVFRGLLEDDQEDKERGNPFAFQGVRKLYKVIREEVEV